MVTIADKINAVLAQRRMLKRDLARALGVAPQTATDICKGRSAVTLPHLRKLCELFQLRPDFWLDETRLEPGPGDRIVTGLDRKLDGLAELGVLGIEDATTFVRRLIDLAHDHRAEWGRRFGEPAADVAAVLGAAMLSTGAPRSAGVGSTMPRNETAPAEDSRVAGPGTAGSGTAGPGTAGGATADDSTSS